MVDYNDYRAPKVTADITFQDRDDTQESVLFHTILIGKGLSVRKRTIKIEDLKVNTKEFPIIKASWDVKGAFNFQKFDVIDFNLKQVFVHQITENGLEKVLIDSDKINVHYAAIAQTFEGKINTIFELVETDLKESELVFDLEFEISIDDNDFKIHTASDRDKLFFDDIFGAHELLENGEEFFNDINFGAEIAFKSGVQKFLYIEVPRNYGEEPTAKDYQKVIEQVFYEKNAYRIVPLTDDLAVTTTLAKFVSAISNPYDERESVCFLNYEISKIDDIHSISELIEKVGGFSEGTDSERVCNVFGATSVEFPLGHKKYILPAYFLNVAVAFLDDKIGMSKPISTRDVTVFSNIFGPSYRPKYWDSLAKKKVFIIYQEKEGGAIKIRHQLTTKQSERAELQEYSTTKNFDATVQLVRERLRPYAGKENITDGYFEKVDATFSLAKQEAIASEFVRDIIPISKWQLRRIGSGEAQKEIKTNIVGHFRLVPLYPGNNIDVHFIV